MEKFLTPKKVREILKMPHTGTAQSDPARISDVFAKHRRSRFRLISRTQQEF
jgi:hypothetical protein